MKTKLILTVIILHLCSFVICVQPLQGTIDLGGSGYFFSSKSKEGDKLKVYNIRPEFQYFLLKNFAVGSAITIKGSKDYSLANNDNYYGIFISPSIEGYIVNRRSFGLSVKGGLNIVASTNYDISKSISSYSIGPKISWNLSPNITTFLWFSYRKLEDFDDTIGFTYQFPSDNFDVRWGFSYYLHNKKEAE